MKVIFKVALLLLIVFLSYLVYDEIMEPIRFQKDANERYAQGVERLMDIRDAQLAHRDAHKKFVSTFDSLEAFIDTGEFYLLQRQDITVIERDPISGIEKYVEKVKIDTIGKVAVKDSLFKNGKSYRDLEKLNINNKTFTISMEAGFQDLSEIPDSVRDQFKADPVFEAKIKRAELLDGLPSDLVLTEINQEGGIEGDWLTVGSMVKPNTEGNWTKEIEQEVRTRKKNSK